VCFKIAGAFLEIARRAKKLKIEKLSHATLGPWLDVVNVIAFITVNESITDGAMATLRKPNPIALLFALQ
jgi:hypothetical protein